LELLVGKFVSVAHGTLPQGLSRDPPFGDGLVAAVLKAPAAGFSERPTVAEN